MMVDQVIATDGADAAMIEGVVARLEKATGPDRELDGLIAEAIGWKRRMFERTGRKAVATWQRPDATHWSLRGPEFFTASIDAAMTLVPEGWRWLLREGNPDRLNPHDTGFFCRLETLDFDSLTYGKGETWITDIRAGQETFTRAPTSALALCIAALKARAHTLSMGENDA